MLVLRHFTNHSPRNLKGMLISNLSNEILGSYIDCICVFYCKLEGILKYFKRFVISRKIHLCMPQILMSTFEVALQLEFQFAPGTTRKFHSLHLFHCLQTVSLLAGFSVQLEPMSSKAMSTLGTEELGTRNSEQGDTFNSYFNQKQL